MKSLILALVYTLYLSLTLSAQANSATKEAAPTEEQVSQQQVIADLQSQIREVESNSAELVEALKDDHRLRALGRTIVRDAYDQRTALLDIIIAFIALVLPLGLGILVWRNNSFKERARKDVEKAREEYKEELKRIKEDNKVEEARREKEHDRALKAIQATHEQIKAEAEQTLKDVTAQAAAAAASAKLAQAENLFSQAFAAGEKKNDEAAIRLYTQVIKIYKELEKLDSKYKEDPNCAITYYNRGLHHAALGEHDKAIEDYSKAIELNPNYTHAYNNRGVSYATLGEHDKAIEDYDKGIELKPNDAPAYINRGVSYATLGKHDKAIEDYTKAIELKPNYASAYNNRGLSHAALKDYKRAIKDFGEAINLDDEYADPWLALTCVCIYNLKPKRVGAALCFLVQALELGYDLAEAQADDEVTSLFKGEHGAMLLSPEERRAYLKTHSAQALLAQLVEEFKK